MANITGSLTPYVCGGGEDKLKELESVVAEKAPKEHTHTKEQITNFPTSLPASDVYSWAKQPSKPTYTASEVGAAASNHNHDGRYYTEAEVNNLLSSIRTRLNNLEGSVDMAKLVYSANVSVGIQGAVGATYANADFVVVKPVGGTTYSSSSTGMTRETGATEGVKIMKGCDGRAYVFSYYRSNRGDSSHSFMDLQVAYNANGQVVFGTSIMSEYITVYCHLEFYKQ